IAELNATNNALVRSYTWGLDLSGSLDAAGGIGGLLLLNSPAAGPNFYAFDGNGNNAAFVSGTHRDLTAAYEYEGFGGSTKATGPMAKENSFRFSTKRIDTVTDLVLYELRPYCPSEGRFICMDPVEEQGGNNLYAFAANDPVKNADALGLIIVCD